MHMRISAVVLAAGESRRMGQTKQLLPLEGKVLLQQVLDPLKKSDVDEIILVLGHDAERIQRAVVTREIKVVINTNYRAGMITSIQQGLAALDKRTAAFFIVLGDQPGVSPVVYNRLMAEFNRAHPLKSIILPAYRGRRGHPALFSIGHREESLLLHGDLGLRQILLNHAEDILLVEMDTDAILEDIDTPEDYRKYLAKGSPKNPAKST